MPTFTKRGTPASAAASAPAKPPAPPSVDALRAQLAQTREEMRQLQAEKQDISLRALSGDAKAAARVEEIDRERSRLGNREELLNQALLEIKRQSRAYEDLAPSERLKAGYLRMKHHKQTNFLNKLANDYLQAESMGMTLLREKRWGQLDSLINGGGSQPGFHGMARHAAAEITGSDEYERQLQSAISRQLPEETIAAKRTLLETAQWCTEDLITSTIIPALPKALKDIQAQFEHDKSSAASRLPRRMPT